MTPNSIVWKMNVLFFFFFFFFLGGGGGWTTVLFWNPWYYYWDYYCKRKWSSYLNVKNRYLGMTGVTKKLHKSIAKLNYELNNSKKNVWGVVKSPILMIRVAGIIIARISNDFHKSWTKNNIILKLFGFCRVFSPRLVPRQLGDDTAVWCMCGDQVPVNLQTARKCTGIIRIYMLHINPDTPLAANGEVNNFKVQHQKSFNCIFLTAVQMCNKQ